MTPGRFGVKGLEETLRRTAHDLIWLNGFFDRDFTISVLMLRRLGRLPRRPAILSPRGEFSTEALAIKAVQKRLYLQAAWIAGLLRDVWLHGTSESERDDIRRGYHWARDYLHAPDTRLPVYTRNLGSLPGPACCGWPS